MEDTPATPTPSETPEASEAPEASTSEAPQKELIELEIDGAKRKFKPEQILNVIKNYESLQSKSKEFEASQMQMENLIANLKENPNLLWDFAESLGHDPRELTKTKFKEYLDYEKMTPEQKKIYELERRLKATESEKEKYTKEKEQQEYEAKVTKYYQQIEKEFSDFYQKSGIKPSKDLAMELIKIQREELDLSGKRPSVEKAYETYSKKRDQLRKALLSQLSEEDIPEEVLKAARKKLQSDARKFKPPEQRAASRKKETGATKKKGLTIDDFFR